jgi:hypothetical protein
MEGLIKMPYKSISNIIAVWLLNGISWLIAFNTSEVLDRLQFIKEILAIVSLVLAISFTAYKFIQGWKGWNPRRKK